MVRVTSVLARVPVIKFRKGGLGARPTQTASSPPPAPGSKASPQVQTSSTMSTSSVPDIDLPPRYRRAPLTQEEIDHINGGGIV